MSALSESPSGALSLEYTKIADVDFMVSKVRNAAVFTPAAMVTEVTEVAK